MPDQRMLHPKQSLSRKVTALSDFDYRVWEQTKLSSDDFGVMPFTATVLQAANLRLRKAPERQVFEALRRLVEAELLLQFDHQGESYVCAPVWQTWQLVAFPRTTHLPKPDATTIGQCDPATQALFALHPGGRKFRRQSGAASESLRNDSGTIPEILPENSRPQARGVPANASANANAIANASEGGAGETRPGAGGGGARPHPGLITNPLTWERQHRGHLDGFCDWMCLPGNVFEDFVRRVMGAGSSEEDAHRDVLAWARSVRQAWEGQIPGDDIFAFWRHEWTKTHGSNRPATVRAGDNLTGLREAVGRG